MTDSTNKKRLHYRPLQQLFKDLENNKVARYNLITPDQYNEMHSALTNGFSYLNDAANPQLDGTTDISDMFKPGVIPKSLPKY